MAQAHLSYQFSGNPPESYEIPEDYHPTDS